MRIPYLSLLLFLAATAAFSQNPEAQLLDVLTYESDNDSDYSELKDRTFRFLESLHAAPPQSRGAITINPKFRFEGDCVDGVRSADVAAEKFLRELLKGRSNKHRERIVILIGEASARSRILFWLVPRGAETPLVPESGFHPPCCCPSADIVGPHEIMTGTVGAVFIADVRPKLRVPTFTWKVSTGRILAGQDTAKIVVDVGKSKTDELTVTVEIGGTDLSCNCPTSLSHVVKIRSR